MEEHLHKSPITNSSATPSSPFISNPFEEDTLDFKKYLYLILTNWYWFLISIFVGLGVAYLINRYTMPVYRATSSIMLNEGTSSKGLSGYENLIPGMEIYAQRKYVINEMEVLRSYSLANRALLDLDFNITYIGVGRSGIKEVVLYKNCPFYVELDSSKSSIFNFPIEIDLLNKNECEIYIGNEYDIRERVKYGEFFSSDVLNCRIFLKDPENFKEKNYNKYKVFLNSLNGLSNLYKNRLGITSNDERRGSVLFLSMIGSNSEQAVNYLNTLMDVYIQQGLEEKNQTATNTVKFIDEQLSVIDDSLQQTEMDLQNFRLTNNLISISTEGQMIYEKLGNLEYRKAELDLKDRYFQYLKTYVKDKNNVNELVVPSTIDISDALLGSLITQLNEFFVEKEELLQTVQKESSQIQVIENKIASTRSALAENIEYLIKNNDIARSQVDLELKKVNSSLKSLPVTERKYIGLQRDYNVNDQIYTYLLEKRAESAIAVASNVADNKILDHARTDNVTKISPKTRTNYMLGLLGGIGIPLALIILFELSNTKITDRNDIDKRTKIPVVAHIGHSEKGDIPVFENPKSSLSESFRGLRTNLQYLLRDSDQKVITVSSTISGEGKTFVSLNLATIFSLSGRKTLLVGLDLRKPKLHRVFNLDNNEGLSSFLIGKSKYSDIIHETKVSNLYMAPSGPVPPNPAELLETREMLVFLEKVRKEFDIIVLDTPPFGVVTDSLLVGRKSDANLFVVRQNYSDRDVINLMNEIQTQQGLSNLGIVFNDLKLSGYYRSGYKYYNYNYTYRYGYIYGSDYYSKD